MSRMAKHNKPLQPSVAAAVANVVAALFEERGWTIAKLQHEFGEASKQLKCPAEDVANAEFAADHKTIKKLVTSGEPINHWHMWGFYLWFMGDHEIRPRLESKIIEFKLKSKLDLLTSFNRFLGFASEFDLKKMQSRVGTYKLYRPSHLNPSSEIFVSSFKVGDGEDVLSCRLTTRYIDRTRRTLNDTFAGQMLPQGDRNMAILRAESHSDAVVVMHFDAIEIRHDEAGSGGDMHGVMLSAIGTGPASAWPFYAFRIEEQETFEPYVIGLDDLSTVPEAVLACLNRGAVHWEERHYPKPYVI